MEVCHHFRLRRYAEVVALLHLNGYRGAVSLDAPAPEKRCRPLRADAERNRERIVTAAAELFAERGFAVPLEEVARVAGVGVATLYRRFPSRTELAVAVFERNISSYADVADRALANPRPGEAFAGLIVDLCALQAGDPGRREMLTTAFPASSVVERQAAETMDKVGEVIARAQREGTVRGDITRGDVVVMLLANAGVLEATARHAPGAWRRFAALMVDAVSTGPRAELPAPTPPEQLRRSVAMLTGDTTSADRQGAPSG